MIYVQKGVGRISFQIMSITNNFLVLSDRFCMPKEKVGF